MFLINNRGTKSTKCHYKTGKNQPRSVKKCTRRVTQLKTGTALMFLLISKISPNGKILNRLVIICLKENHHGNWIDREVFLLTKKCHYKGNKSTKNVVQEGVKLSYKNWHSPCVSVDFLKFLHENLKIPTDKSTKERRLIYIIDCLSQYMCLIYRYRTLVSAR